MVVGRLLETEFHEDLADVRLDGLETEKQSSTDGLAVGLSGAELAPPPRPWQGLGSAWPGNVRPEDREAGHAAAIRGDRGEPDVGGVQHLLDSVDVGHPLADKRRPVTGQRAVITP